MNLYSLVFGSFLLAPLYSGLLNAAPNPLASDQQVEHIYLRSGELPEVSLSADIMYRVLVAEVAAQGGDFDTASQTFLDLARDTLDPRFAEKSFQLSMVDYNQSRALRAAREWNSLAPENPEAKATVLALEASAGNTKGMAQALRQRINSATNKEQAIIQAMSLSGRMVDPRLALEVLEEAIPPELRQLPVAHLALSDVAWAAQRPARALYEARQALERSPDSEAAAQRVLEYGLHVDVETALKETSAVVQQNPDMRKLQLLLISRFVDHRKFNEALALIDAMQVRNPEDFDLLYTKAEVLMRAQRYDEAIQDLDEFISVQSQRRRSVNDGVSNALAGISDARLLLVRIAEERKDYAEAIRQLDLIEEPMLRFQSRVHRAVLEARSGDLKKAQRTLDALGTQDRQEQAVVALTRAAIYREAGRTDNAITVLERANKELPDTAEVKYDLGMLYERQGRYPEFEKLMREVIELEPGEANAYNALGYTLAEQNRNLDEAQDLLEQAMELDPANPYILDSVGWYLFRVGDYQAAAEYLERSYAIMPVADVAAHLGEVYWVDGRPEQAKQVWAEALAQDPTNEALLSTLKRLGVTLP